jgi:hypothetical protein
MYRRHLLLYNARERGVRKEFTMVLVVMEDKKYVIQRKAMDEKSR